jgi:hypothetical protein
MGVERRASLMTEGWGERAARHRPFFYADLTDRRHDAVRPTSRGAAGSSPGASKLKVHLKRQSLFLNDLRRAAIDRSISVPAARL